MSVMALLVTTLPAAGPVAAHTVDLPGANDVYNGTWPPNANPGWNVPAANPDLNPDCGIDVGILIDRSGSIADAGQQVNMRESAKDIVEALAGTPSQVGVWSFGSSSSATGTVEHPAQQLTKVGGPTGPAGVASLSATIDSIPIVSGVATNWEAGFASVDTASDAGTDPDLLFVLTDGNPTVHVDDSATGGTTNNDDVDGGIRTANLVKANGTRIFGVGIGAGITSSTLGLVANPLAYDGTNFATAGYTLTSFAALSETVRALAIELCGGSVTVQKLADDGDGSFDPAQGWEFTLDPANAGIPSQTDATDDQGQVNFALDSFTVEQVTLTEDLAGQSGYVFLADELVCTNSNGDDPILTPVANGATFDLGPTDIIECTFKNKREFVDLSIAKDDGGVSTVPGGEVTYTLTYGNAGNVDAPNTVIAETVPADTTVDLGSGPADGKNDGWLCAGADNGVFVAGTACTYAAGTVPAGASGLTVPFTVTVVNPAPFGLTEISNTATIDYDETSGPDTNPDDNTSTDTTPVVVDPQIAITKTVVTSGGLCPGVDEVTIVAGESVTYCYVVTNPGNAPTIDVVVVDDNATPGDTSDDFPVVLSGLTDEDGDGTADDLAPGASASGQSAVTVFAAGGTFVNVATATGGGESASDDATVIVTQPAVNVVKTAVVTGDACPGIDGVNLGVVTGQSVTFCYVVTNPGTAPLLNVTVVDDNATPGTGDDFAVTLSGLTDEDGDGTADDLAAGETATGSSSPKAFDATGSFTNVATAAGESASDAQFSDTDPATVVVTAPQVDIVKTAVASGDACPGIDGVNLTVVAGDEVTYCYVVTNPGSAPLLNVTVVDDNATPGTGDDFAVTLSGLTDEDGDGTADDLAAGASATGQSPGKEFAGAGSFTNIATVDGASASGAELSETDDATVVVTRPGLTIVKTAVADPAGCPGVDGVTLVVDEGDDVRYCYVVTNPGDAPLLNVTVVDDNGTPLVPGDDFAVTLGGLTDEDGDGTADDLAAGATATGASSLVSFEPGSVINVATADGSSSTGEPFEATDTAVVTARDVPPTVVVTKTAGVDSVLEPGGPVTFTVEVENTSDEAVTVTSITDSVEGGAPFSVLAPATAPVTATTCVNGSPIAAGGTYTCTFTLNVSGDAGDVVDDTVVATVVDNDQTTASDDDDASVEITDVPPVITVTKGADPSSLPEPGGPVTFPVTVTNNSFESVTVTSITDSVEGGAPFSVTAPATAPVTATTCETGVVIAPGEPYECTFTLNVSGDAGDVVDDTVVASVVDNDGTPASDDDDASVEITDVPPTVVVTKTAGVDSVPEPGGPVTFTVEVENTSFEAVTVTAITDSVEGGAPFSVLAPATAPVTATTCAAGAEIAAGDTYTCTFTLNVSGNAGDVVDDTVVATVVDNDGTTASDDDDASVEITDVPPTIEVTKDDDGASVGAPGGPVEYTVEVTNTSFEAVTITSITDSIDGGEPFDVTAPATDPVLETSCATGVEIPAGETYTCTFTVLVEGLGGEIVEDTVVVSVVDDDGTPVEGSDDETTPVTPVVDLAVVKTADQPTFTVGTQAVYTLVVSNAGPSTATDVVVTDTLPTGLSLVGIDEPSGWNCSGSVSIRCTTPTLAAGASATITVTVLVGADAVGQVTNVVEVDSEEPDADPSDNRDEVTTPVTQVLGAVVTPPAPAVLTTAALPYTGSDSARMVLLGAGFLVLGGLLVLATRRRRQG
jgi:uncharacterized repeat protein (TIGR01451 family)/LPXTG-motif cell wall-anchored protein